MVSLISHSKYMHWRFLKLVVFYTGSVASAQFLESHIFNPLLFRLPIIYHYIWVNYEAIWDDSKQSITMIPGLGRTVS